MRLDLLKPIGMVLLLWCSINSSLAVTPNIQVSYFPSGEPIYYSFDPCKICDNITNGGAIGTNEVGCPNPIFDPHEIYNITLPSGGTGTIEYQWLYTYENPNYPSAVWNPIANANNVTYDPGPITITTYYIRCSRRSGCTIYTGETNFVMKLVQCCPDNILDGGLIAANQKSCSIPYDPEKLTNAQTPTGSTGVIFYQWLSSSIGGSTNNGTWTIIPGETADSYDPPLLSKTMYFVRRAREEFCPNFEYSNTIKITVTNGVLISSSKVDPTCFESENGSATVTVTQGTGPYVYKWSNSVIMTPTLINLGGGMYKVTVTDVTGCSANTTIILNEPGEITILGTIEPIACVGLTTGKVTIAVMGGTPIYTYKWSSGETVPSISNKAGGSYSVTVTDAKQCTTTKTFTILEGVKFSITPTITNNICFGDKAGSIKLSVTGGVLPYNYKWSNGNLTNEILNLETGTYTVTITDNNNCSAIATYNITETTDLNINSKAFSPKCFSGHDGSIVVTVSGGKSPYKYKWSVAGSTQILSGLTAGAYSLTITDANLCTKTKSFILQNPSDISISGTVINPDCAIGNNGSIDITVTGGTSPYTYEWNGNLSSQDLKNLSEGAYKILVADSIGCTKEQVFNLTIANDISVSETIIEPYCQSSNGSIILNVSGGIIPYTYLWSDSSSSNQLSGLSAGIYNVTITDSVSCSKVKVFNLSDQGGVDILSNSTDILCFNDSSGSINIIITGGIAPYQIEWSNGILNSQSLNNLSAGNYTVTVTDKNSCVTIQSFEIQGNKELQISDLVEHPGCFNSKDGSIQLTVSGGTGPYNYLWSNGSTTKIITGLGGGTYITTVTDIIGCTLIDSFKIEEPKLLSATEILTKPNCFNGAGGKIDLTVFGGTPAYSFTWSTGSTTEDQDSLTSNIYSVTITDSKSCSIVRTFILTEPIEIQLQAIVKNTTCNGGNDATISLTIIGGTSPYTYLWSNGSITKDLANLTAGNYEVTVNDVNGCSQMKTFSVSEENDLVVQEKIVQLACFGGTTGSIDLTVTGGIVPYIFNWSTGAQTSFIVNLAAGTYDVTITDHTGCKSVKTYTITQPTEMNISLNKLDVSCVGDSNGKIVAKVIGGTLPFSFLWSTNSINDTIQNLPPGTYSLTVTDANNCSKVVFATILEPLGINITGTTGNTSCSNTVDGLINLSVSGGTSPYTYLWNNNTTSQNLNLLAPGNYTVTVTDKNGCTKSEVFTIGLPIPVNFNLSITDQSCINQNNGSASIINITGGTPGYSFKWNTPNNSTTQTVNNLAPGLYQVTVNDSKGCGTVKGFEIKPTAISCILKIGDYVWLDTNKNGIQDSTENGINGINVHLINVGADTISGTGDDILTDTKTTKPSNGKDGYYFFQDVPKGRYVIKFFVDGNLYKFTIKDVGTNDAKDSDVNPGNSMTDQFEIKTGDPDNLTYDAGIYQYCKNITNGGLICCDEVLCSLGETPALIKNVQIPTGGTGPIEYLWLYSTKNPIYFPGSPDWIMIPNSNNPSYQPGPLFETTYFIRCAKTGDCSNFAGESNAVTKRVVDGKEAEIFGAPATICKNKYVDLSSVNYGPGVSYLWDLGPGAIPPVATTNNISVIWAFPGVKPIKLYVSFDSCTSEDVAVIVVSNCISSIKIEDYNAIRNDQKQEDPIEKDPINNIETIVNDIAVYPNPANTLITIEPLTNKGYKGSLEITNTLGVQFYVKDLNEDFKLFKIDISKYKAGLYFIKVKGEDGKVTIYKIIKID